MSRKYHGHSKVGSISPEYRCWLDMKTRCYSPRCKKYSSHGARGVRVCRRWRKNFLNFLADMGPRPSSAHSLDRINNNGNYSPKNCRWATIKIQNRNTRRNVFVEFLGQKMVLQEATEKSGINKSTLWKRFNKGDRGEKLFRPIQTEFSRR